LEAVRRPYYSFVRTANTARDSVSDPHRAVAPHIHQMIMDMLLTRSCACMCMRKCKNKKYIAHNYTILPNDQTHNDENGNDPQLYRPTGSLLRKVLCRCSTHRTSKKEAINLNTIRALLVTQCAISMGKMKSQFTIRSRLCPDRQALGMLQLSRCFGCVFVDCANRQESPLLADGSKQTNKNCLVADQTHLCPDRQELIAFLMRQEWMED
jgi:hypothetical protein